MAARPERETPRATDAAGDAAPEDPVSIESDRWIRRLAFFEADADGVRETSCADQAGKDQRQRGVTLPTL